MSDLNIEDTIGIQRLSQDIVETAAGVFLRVRLVVRSLLEGLQNYDRVPDLRRRLQALPQDLDALFGHMLQRVPVEYKLESSRMFQLVQSHHRVDHDVPISALTLGLAEDHHAQAARSAISEIPQAARHYIEKQVAGRLRSQCAGLLEIQLRDDRYPHTRISNKDYPLVPCVEYLHKSVADFLGTEDIRADILQYTRGTDFNAEISLLQAIVQKVRVSKSDLGKGYHVWSSLQHAMIYAKAAEKSTISGSIQLLDQLDACMTEHFKSIESPEILDQLNLLNRGQVMSWCDCVAFHSIMQRIEPQNDTFVSFAIQHGLELYVHTKFTQMGMQGFRKRGRPLLYYACDFDFVKFYPDQMLRVRIIEFLLKYGADPMERWGRSNNTAWEYALVIGIGDIIAWVNIIKLFVNHGVDMTIRISDPVLDLEEMDDRPKEWSPLSYIKRRMEMATKDPFDPAKREWSRHPDYQKGVPLPSHVVIGAKVAFEDLIRDMVARGAKDGRWLLMSDGSYKADDSEQGMSDTRAPTKIKPPRSIRNPIKRVLQRLKS